MIDPRTVEPLKTLYDMVIVGRWNTRASFGCPCCRSVVLNAQRMREHIRDAHIRQVLAERAYERPILFDSEDKQIVEGDEAWQEH